MNELVAEIKYASYRKCGCKILCGSYESIMQGSLDRVDVLATEEIVDKNQRIYVF
jgi:hypothetical protein